MKKYRCCIPGCETYDTLNIFLPVPEDFKWRIRWLSAVPRKDWVADASTLICIKHFNQMDFVISSNINLNNQNKENTTQTVTPVLVPNAVPSIFPKLNECVNPEIDPASIYTPRYMFECYLRDVNVPELFVDVENWENSDYVVDFCYLKLIYQKALLRYLNDGWKDVSSMDYVILFTTDFSETSKIPVCIKVDKNLQVTVILAGRLVDPIDLTWILPIGGKLNRWSQLKTLMAVLGKSA